VLIFDASSANMYLLNYNTRYELSATCWWDVVPEATTLRDNASGLNHYLLEHWGVYERGSSYVFDYDIVFELFGFDYK